MGLRCRRNVEILVERVEESMVVRYQARIAGDEDESVGVGDAYGRRDVDCVFQVGHLFLAAALLFPGTAEMCTRVD